MHLLENPQDKYPTIHVAGTKGKGSTCAMIANILTKSGLKTGFYSSPHINIFRERIRIDGKYISKDDVINLVGKYRLIEKNVPSISTFELITAMGFEYFAIQEVDAAVIEVGLGGRLDATNIINPNVSVITSISMDHMSVLGNSLQKIAYEKGGIIKKNVPVISSAQSNAARVVLREKAKDCQSELIFSDEAYPAKILGRHIYGQTFKVDSKIDKMEGIFSLPLIGDHQVENAVTAIASIHQMRKLGWAIHDETIRDGLKTVVWPGRLEVLDENPIFIVDGAHNEESFSMLMQTINGYFKGKNVVMIFGASEDKEIQKMLRIVKSKIKKFIFTKTNHPRAADVNYLEKIGNDLNLDFISAANIEKSIELALDSVGDKDVVIASGSLFIAGAIRSLYYSRFL
jgi:dihydrofolate synthase/folylpolyglutamate synthase